MDAPCRMMPRYAILVTGAALLGFAPLHAVCESPAASARAFIAGLSIADDAKKALEARVATGGDVCEWVAEVGDTIFGIATAPIDADPDARMQQLVAQAAAKHAKARALNLLFVHAAGEHYSAMRYRNRDAVANALVACEGSVSVEGRLSPGVQAQGAAVGDCAVAVAFASADKVNLYRAKLPPEDKLQPFYCQSLYTIAQSLVVREKFRDALPLLRDLHDLKWERPEVCLDTAKCFLGIDQKEDANTILQDTLDRFGPALTSEQAELVGDLMLQVGAKAEAGKAFQLSLEKLHEENGRQDDHLGSEKIP